MMKTTTKIIGYFLTGVIVLGLNSGCKKLEDFGDTNVDPNGSTYAETANLLSAVETRLGSRTFASNDAAATTDAGFFVQYFSEPTYPGLSRYTVPQVNSSAAYSGPLYDLKKIIDRNTDPATIPAAANSGSNANQIAIARILKAYIFSILTDRWGDMPYSEALQGLTIPNPKYDRQEDIYKDLLKELGEAVAQIDDQGLPIKGDLIYSGDMSKWRKFGNSLHMILALRLSKVYPNAGDYAATEFVSAASGPFMTSNSENFQLKYGGNTTNYNSPWYGTGNSADLGESLTMTDLLQGLSDTRIGAFGSNNNGVPYGLAAAAPTNVTYAKILSPAWKDVNSVYVFINSASVLLAQAEAIQRGWISGDDKAAYDAGVTLSFEQWGVTMPANYLTTGPANYNTGAGVASIGGSSVAGSNALTPTKLLRIQLQQYLAFYPNANQAYANWRRTEYKDVNGVIHHMPDLKPSVFPATSHTAIPRRFTYGPTEYSTNLEQVTIAAQNIGGDDQDTRVWWDKQP